MANPEKQVAPVETVSDEATVTPVLNNTEHMILLPLQGVAGKGGGISPGGRVDLLPGMNFPDTKLWKRAKETEGCRLMLKDKILPSKSPEQSPERIGRVILEERKPVGKDNPLATLSEEAAVEMIDELFSVPMMKKFLAQEERAGVRAGLKAQIHKIEHPPVRKAI